MPTLTAFFESAKLPVMSEVAHSLVRSLNDPAATAAQIESIIGKDPALTANLLRMANSAQFGMSRQVLSLDHAITLLGMSRIRSLALSTSISTACRAWTVRHSGNTAWLAPGMPSGWPVAPGWIRNRPGWPA
jgi:HD-like signal output (HDOD) protein